MSQRGRNINGKMICVYRKRKVTGIIDSFMSVYRYIMMMMMMMSGRQRFTAVKKIISHTRLDITVN